jgi:hypothetical protein
MIVEIFTTTDRLPYLQKNMNDKIVVMSHPDGTGQVKVQVVVGDAMDVMNIFHAGVSYGLDKMQAVYTNK